MRNALGRVFLVAVLAFAFGCDMLTDTTVHIGGFEIVQGHDITATVGSDVTASARVVTSGGDPVEGVDVTFTVVSGGGSVSPRTVTSGSDGTVEVTWTLGTEPGAQRLRAGARAFELTFRVTAETGPLAVLVASADSVHFTALHDDQRITVSGEDQYGNETEVGTLGWSSNNTGVATVSGGVITAMGSGAATVTVTSGSVADQVRVGVEQVVADVNVSPAGQVLNALGDTVHLSAEILDANDYDVSGASASWSSLNPSVATVGGAGVVTAVAGGTARVVASADGVADTATITVVPVTATVVVSPDSVGLISLGATSQLSASALDANGNDVAGAAIIWSSRNPAVASVSSQGLVTAVAEGITRVQASVSTSSGTIRDSARVVVMPVVARLEISVDTLHFVSVGDTVAVEAHGFDANSNDLGVQPVGWTVLDLGVATVDAGGNVASEGNGATRLVADMGALADTIGIGVRQEVFQVVVTPELDTIPAVGDTVRLDGVANDSSGFAITDTTVAWTSDDAAVATVDAGGLVTAVGQGTTNVVGTVADKADTAVIVVQSAADSLVVAPDSLHFTALGDTSQLAATAYDIHGSVINGAEITWSTLNDSIATVDTAGNVISVAAGTTSVVASTEAAGGGTVTRSVPVVVEPVVTRLEISVDTLHFVSLGDTVAVQAHGFDVHDNDLGTQPAGWTVLDTAVARVDGSGNVSSEGNGATRLVADLAALADTIGIGVRQEVFQVIVTPELDTIPAVGDTLRVTGTVNDSSGIAITDTTVIWTSTDTAVATVDTSGLVTAAGPGTTNVIGTVADRADTAVIVVYLAADSMTVAPDSLYFTALGDTTQLVATAYDTNENVIDSPDLTWTSLNTAVCTVDSLGNVISVGEGTTTVTVGAPAVGGGELTRSVPVVVEPVAAYIRIVPDSVHLTAFGDTSAVAAHGYDANDNDLGVVSVTWTGTDPGIATVDTAGNVVAVANGDAKVAAELASPLLHDTAGIGVYQEVAMVSIWPTADTIAMTDTLQLVAEAYDARGNFVTRSYSIDWSSDDIDVAWADGVGTTEGRMVGSTTIHATVEGEAAGASILVAPYPSRALAVGNAMGCALDIHGNAYCWGEDQYEMQGDGVDGYDFHSSANPVAGAHVFQQIVAGGDAVCALDTAGQAWCWGDNWAGEVGNGFTENSLYSDPVAVVGGHTFTFIALNGYHVCAIDDADAAWCWGYGDTNQLGDGLFTSSGTPVAVSGGLSFIDISPGWYHTCGLTDSNVTFCWGYNGDLQFGDGTTADSPTPVVSANGEAYVSIEMDWWGGCGIEADGTGHCWGYNGSGRVGDGTETDADYPHEVAGGYTWRTLNPSNGWTCGLTDGGTITCVGGGGGSGRTGQGTFTNVATHTPIASGETFVAVDAEINATCGLTDTGVVYCWGSSGGAAVNPNTETPTLVGLNAWTVAISGGFSCALQNTGDVWCWGSNGSGQLGDGTTEASSSAVQVAGGISFSRLATGWGHACGIGTADSLAYCWGDNDHGQVGDGTSSNTRSSPTATTGGIQFADITAGASFTCGLSIYGEVYCWGDNTNGQVGDSLDVGMDITTPTLIDSDSLFVAVTAGNYHACALTGAGQGWCWGANGAGELGNTTPGSDSPEPVLVLGNLVFDTLSAGGDHTCGITSDTNGWCWGNNDNGQLGNGSDAASTTPVILNGGLSWARIAATGSGTCGIDTGNALYCWGDNSSYQLATGNTDAQWEPTRINGIAARAVEGSAGHVCAVATNDATYCWGFKNYGQTADGMAYLPTPTPVTTGFNIFTGLSPLGQAPSAYLDVGPGWLSPITGTRTTVRPPPDDGAPPPDAGPGTGGS